MNLVKIITKSRMLPKVLQGIDILENTKRFIFYGQEKVGIIRIGKILTEILHLDEDFLKSTLRIGQQVQMMKQALQQTKADLSM